ncbi:hypothetical protein CAEBREN_17419 [Caenorhabditis brenneri]|uniref:Uncharacterized protein n=1 Tax=Caenorhabditis brenneri TaxID=135651 RepID=G0NDU9_CAEBE|nr:hypothetical protein CAEBREN_17419 [Caenorhabditis brenneri]
MDGPSLKEKAFRYLLANNIKTIFPGFTTNSVYQASRLQVKVMAKPHELKEDRLEGDDSGISRYALATLGHMFSKCSFVLQESMLRGDVVGMDQNHMTYTHVMDPRQGIDIHFVGKTTMAERGMHLLSFQICAYVDQKELVYAMGSSSVTLRPEATINIALSTASDPPPPPSKSSDSSSTDPARSPSAVGTPLPALDPSSSDPHTGNEYPAERLPRGQTDQEDVTSSSPPIVGVAKSAPDMKASNPLTKDLQRSFLPKSAAPPKSSSLEQSPAAKHLLSDRSGPEGDVSSSLEFGHSAIEDSLKVEARNLHNTVPTVDFLPIAAPTTRIPSDSHPTEASPTMSPGSSIDLTREEEESRDEESQDRAVSSLSSILRRPEDVDAPVTKKKRHVSFGGFDGEEEKRMRYMAVNVYSPHPGKDTTVQNILRSIGLAPKNMSIEPLPIKKGRRHVFGFEVRGDVECSLMENLVEGKWYENLRIKSLYQDPPKVFFMKGYPMSSLIELICLAELVAFNFQVKEDYVPEMDTTDLLINKRNIGEAMDLGIGNEVMKGLSAKGQHIFTKEVKPKAIPISKKVLSATLDY